MKSKFDIDKDISVKNTYSEKNKILAKKPSRKSDEDEISEDDLELDEKPLKKGKASAKNKKDEEEDVDDADDVKDDWEKSDDDDYDPDFEEFDIPKSKIKSGPFKKGKTEDDELGLDDDYKTLDLFNDNAGEDDDDDEDF